jgi:hypothetical protein
MDTNVNVFFVMFCTVNEGTADTGVLIAENVNGPKMKRERERGVCCCVLHDCGRQMHNNVFIS